MTRVELRQIRIRPARHWPALGTVVRHLLFGLFLVQCVLVWIGLFRSAVLFGGSRWPETVLLLAAAAMTLATLARQLPAQNVVVVAVLVAVLSGAAHSLDAVLGIPFGPCVYGDRMGRRLFGVLPWPVPLIWVVVLLNARGVARLMFRPWQSKPTYGLWVLGATVALAVLFELAFEPFATLVKGYWSWRPTRIRSDWYGAPWVNFLGWAVTVLAILVLAIPFLIHKKPVKSPPPPDYQPLAVWLALQMLFLTGAVMHRLWLEAGVVMGQSSLVTTLALLGARGSAARRRARPRAPV